MQLLIHPEIRTTSVECASCDITFEIRSTVESLRLDVCSNCHPAYTGQVRVATTGSRIERFTRRYERAFAASAS